VEIFGVLCLVVEVLVSDFDAGLIDGFRGVFSFRAWGLMGFPHLFVLADSTIGVVEDLVARIRSVTLSTEKDIIGWYSLPRKVARVSLGNSSRISFAISSR
jgi:hypothetical protein